jgi:anti-anti-sigma regulatory factor
VIEPDMMTLKHFSQYASHVDKLACDTLPAVLSFDNYRFSIHHESNGIIISCTHPFLINNRECTHTEFSQGDLIKFDHEFILFDNTHHSVGYNVFVGKIRIPDADGKLLIFKLQRKNTGKDFNEISDIAARVPDAGKIFVDTSATQFMDSDAIQSMMTLIQQLGKEKRSIVFYKPSQKFISYLKLANIEKKAPVLPFSNRYIDQFIENSAAGRQNVSGAVHFSLSDGHKQFTMLPETVFPVGRMNTICGLSLSDSQISRIHVLFINTDARIYLIDCSSTNFSYINGRKVTPYCLESLKDNDTVTFGQASHFTIQRI